jgi:hypothetical protein
MPGLVQSLQGHDLGHLKIVAENWGIGLSSQEPITALDQLQQSLLDKKSVAETWNKLPDDSQTALTQLAAHQGRLPWPQFVRDYGDLREMGIARRDKEQPHRDPSSTTELLWYHGLIGRAFLETPNGPAEFAFIPDDLLTLLPIPENKPARQFGRSARPDERAHVIPATDQILDEACTLLAALRLGLSSEQIAQAENWRMPPKMLEALLATAGILDANGQPIPKAARAFLSAARADALAQLVSAWMKSTKFNEQSFLPGILSEGNWQNDSLSARQKLIAFARSASAQQWWSIGSLIADIKTHQPDFQRPAGDYDSWYLRATETGQYLRGFEHWDAVDGALIAFMLRGPLHWLGLIDLASPGEGQPATAFRWASNSAELLKGKSPKASQPEISKVKVDSQGKLFVPRLAPRVVRYQLARFSIWLVPKAETYLYQITAKSLEAARKQGLKVAQLLALLKANSATPLPPNLLQALKRWEQNGSQIRLSPALVLRVQSAAALKALRSSKAARYLGEPLGPTAITVKPGAGQNVLQVLTELGYLGELEE